MRCGGQSVRAFHAQIHQTGTKITLSLNANSSKMRCQIWAHSANGTFRRRRRTHISLGVCFWANINLRFGRWPTDRPAAARTCPQIVNARPNLFSVICCLPSCEWLRSSLSQAMFNDHTALSAPPRLSKLRLT
jgi:hypothetical protein